MRKMIIAAFLVLTGMLLTAEENVAPLVIKAVSVQGRASYKYYDEKWQTLHEGFTLERGAAVRTGLGSTLSLSVGKSMVNLSPLTQITIEQAIKDLEGGSDVSVFQSKGRTLNVVNPLIKGKRTIFTVTTPIAVASVRGTEFIVDADGYVSCLEGNVYVSRSDRDHASVRSDKDFRLEPPKDGRRLRKGEHSGFDSRGHTESPFDKPPREKPDREPRRSDREPAVAPSPFDTRRLAPPLPPKDRK